MSFADRNVLRSLTAFGCGAAVPLGFAPFGWFPVPLLALAGLALLLIRAPSGQALWYGWLFGLGQFGVGVYWVYISIYLYGNAGLALSLLVMLLFVAFLALYPALLAWLLAKARGLSRGVWLLALFPAAWTFTEWLRGWLFTGFPWLNIGYSQIDSPLSGLAPLFGVYGVSWAAVLSAGLLAYLLSVRGLGRAGAAAALLLLWAGGLGLAQTSWTRPLGEPLQATLIQGNIAQDLKWRPEQRQGTLRRYLALTGEHPDSRVVVWPETAIPAFYDQVEDSFLEPLRRRMAARDTWLLTGVPVLERNNWHYYNAVISLNQPDHFYYKVHLVPFGEYLPLRGWLASLLAFLPVPEADFSAGRLDQPLLQAAGYAVGASICYEIAFGEQLIHALPQAAWLVNVSNDAWFGDSLAPHQHLEMARMRARETQRYLLRATNTGISAIIDWKGRIVERSAQFVTAAVTADIQPRAGATPYVRWGNMPVVIAAPVLIIIALAFRRGNA